MQIQTSRFGDVSIEKEDLVQFPEGILGFNDLRSFVFLEDPSDDIFAWLQSAENPAIAFPVLEPEFFADDYNVTLAKNDIQSLKLENGTSGFRVFSIVTIPEDPTKMTANLKAPIVVNMKAKLARQCVLQNNRLAICEPIFTKLQQRVVANPQAPIKSEGANQGLAIKLPDVPVLRAPEQPK